MLNLKRDVYRYLLPNLLEIQRGSFCWFLEKGLIQEIENFSTIKDYLEVLELSFSTKSYRVKAPKYNLEESKRRDTTYSIRIYIVAKLHIEGNSEVKQDKVFLGDIPLMTNEGTFLVNGIERIVINQLVRSPGIYYKSEVDKQNSRTYIASLISNRGTWVKFEIGKDDILNVRLDKAKKFSVYVFLRALGLTDQEILNHLDFPDFFHKTINEYENLTRDSAFLEVHNKLKPGEPATIKGGQQLLYSKFFDPKRYDLGNVGRYKLNQRLKIQVAKDIRVLTSEDILLIINELVKFYYASGNEDDIDHLGNRRVRSVGELLQNQVRIGLNRLERIVRDRMTICEQKYLHVKTLVNPKPLVSSIREFFGSNPLSQFMDQTNPLAELTHKRRLSVLGPGGITRDRAGFAVRDIHPSQYGRICPIETPEGPNAGLIGSLSTYARINSYGFIETPFYKVEQKKILKDQFPIYLTASQEDKFNLATGDIPVLNGYIVGENIPVRFQQELTTVAPENVDFVAISPIQVVSLATALIPFLEHDDANRALMGSNMQRQSVPLIFTEAPLIGTGLEGQTARDSGMVIVSSNNGRVVNLTNQQITIRDNTNNKFSYLLHKYVRSNQDTCITQKPLVTINEKVFTGQIIADGASTESGELAVGQNITIAYMPWEGYNYEDAFIISDRLVYDDLYTSLHIEKFEIDVRQTKLGIEEITRDLPNIKEKVLSKLDQNGIITIGSWVEAGDILVGKLTPKGESDYSPEGKLLHAIFGEKSRDVRNTSLKASAGNCGRVIDIKVFSRSKGDDLPPGTNELIKVFIAQTRKIQIGDKMAGRHGNKGIISKILPRQDMPFLPDGRPIDMILNPLGVPSRMNVGQIFECLLGLASNELGIRLKVIPFDEMHGVEASRSTVNKKLKEASLYKEWLFSSDYPGKIMLRDGRNSEYFENPVTVGQAYMLKLVHLVDDKIHARSTGPYSLVTQQPLGGRAQQGGQRLGEMEVWALEAFGAAYTLQELLTIKSDDMKGRNEALNSIVKGYAIPRPGTPESFKVLMRELQALCLDIAAYKVADPKNTLNVTEVDLMDTTIHLDHKLAQKKNFFSNLS